MEVAYCEEVITVIKNEPKIVHIPAVKEKLNVLKEVVEDYHEQLHYSADDNGRVGYNTADLLSMEIQGATAMFAVNLKRILTLLKEK